MEEWTPQIITQFVVGILGFAAFIGTMWTTGQRIDSANARIDAQGQRIDALHREIMELIKKMK